MLSSSVCEESGRARWRSAAASACRQRARRGERGERAEASAARGSASSGCRGSRARPARAGARRRSRTAPGTRSASCAPRPRPSTSASGPACPPARRGSGGPRRGGARCRRAAAAAAPGRAPRAARRGGSCSRRRRRRRSPRGRVWRSQVPEVIACERSERTRAGELLVGGEDRAALADAELLLGEEREAAEPARRCRPAARAAASAPMRLGGVLDQRDPARVAELAHGPEVRRVARTSARR